MVQASLAVVVASHVCRVELLDLTQIHCGHFILRWYLGLIEVDVERNIHPLINIVLALVLRHALGRSHWLCAVSGVNLISRLRILSEINSCQFTYELE